MVLIIFGATGMLGTYMTLYLSEYYDITEINRSEIDVYKLYLKCELISRLEAVLLSIIKDKDVSECYVLNCMGDISKTSMRAESEAVLRQIIINSYFPIILNKICLNLGVKMFHFSTDCIYSGLENINDIEEDFKVWYPDIRIPDPLDIYGLSKLFGEQLNCCVLRCSIIGHDQHNKSLMSWCFNNKNKQVDGYTNHLWNGVCCLEYSKFIHYVILEKIYWIGPLNLGSRFGAELSISKHNLIKAISDIYNLNLDITPVKTKINCDRRLQPHFIFDTDFFTQLQEMREFSQKNNI